jgi:hypothetical protein
MLEWGLAVGDCRHRLVIVCILLLHSCRIASSASPSPGSSTPERCHPENMLLHIRVKSFGRSTAAAGRAAHWERFVGGVAQGSRYEARLSLVNEGVGVHEEWRQFHGAVEQDVQVQLISFTVQPLPAGRYTEHLEVYDACGLSASLSESTEEDQRLRLLAGLTHVVHVQEADVERAAGLQEASWREFVGGQRAAGLKVSQAHRLTASLMRNYSVTQCIGPTSTRALESRRNHPNPNVEEDFLLAGQESDFGGGTANVCAGLKTPA